MNLSDKILYFIFFPIISLGVILSPMTNDFRIFYGVEELALKFGSFPSSISSYWEIKPIGNHLINYALAAFTNLFVPFQNHTFQEPIIKTICLVSAIIACYLFSRYVLRIKYSFLICFCALFCSLNLNVGQAEFWAILITMVSCALFMHQNKNLHFVAGSLLIFALLMKGTTGALIISAICIVLIFNKKIDWVRGGIGFVTTGLLFFVASQTIWPEMIPDIFIAPILSHVGEYNWFGQVYVTLVAIIISFSIYIPAIGIGSVYGATWLKNHLKNSLPFILLWSAPLIVVWLQSESFAYQYKIFLLPAIVSLVLYERDTPKERPNKKYPRENIIVATTVVLFIMYCFLYAPVVSKYGSEEARMNDYFWSDSNKINAKFDFQNETSVLFMDTGSLPYYTNGINTSCRYIAPLVLQRANPNRSVVRELPQYWEMYNCVMNYQGKYILADGPIGPQDSWFGNDTPEKQKIVEKISSGYKIVHSGAWQIYQRLP